MNGILHRTFGGLKSASARYSVSGLALLGVAFMQSAHADEVMVQPESIFFEGRESTVLSLDAPSAGTVTVNVTDFEWPVALQSLSFSAASASGVLKTETQSNPAQNFQISFNVGSPGAFFAQISAIAGNLAKFPSFPSIGAYSLDVTFNPQITGVPLPPAVWLFATGLLGIVGASRLHRGRGLAALRSVSTAPGC